MNEETRPRTNPSICQQTRRCTAGVLGPVLGRFTLFFFIVFFLLPFIPPMPSNTFPSPPPILHFSISMFLAVYFHLWT